MFFVLPLPHLTITLVHTGALPTLPRSFFFHDPATPELYTLSLHDALPISPDRPTALRPLQGFLAAAHSAAPSVPSADRKSTRLNSSHRCISYAVFCLKKKK